MTDEQKEELRKRLEQSLDVASGITTATKVDAIRHVQAGGPCLVSRCPFCSVPGHPTIMALSGPGKHPCFKCGKWLEFVAPEDWTPDDEESRITPPAPFAP